VSASSQPTTFVQVAQTFELVVCTAAIVALVRLRRARKSAATSWGITIFAVLDLVLLAAYTTVTDDGSLLKHGFTVVLISLLLLVPFGLLMFARSLNAVGRKTARAGGALTVVLIGMTLVSPPFPEAGEKRGTFFSVYLVLLLVGWVGQSVVAAHGLWTVGRGQPAVVRNRMRLLAAGALVIAGDLVSSGASSKPSTNTQVVTTLIGALGIVLLVRAFVLPQWLRAVWRTADLAELAVAERQLMSAVTPEEVAAAIVPAVAQLFGAGGAAVTDIAGRPVLAVGLSDAEVSELAGLDDEGHVVVTPGGLFASRLRDGWLVVRPGLFAPLYGTSELSLLDRVGAYVDLALQRCKLFQLEASARSDAEATNAELQTLLYSVSHDLRNPIISILGYLDVLALEHKNELRPEGQHYLDRISVNAVYIQSLIQDLLELSRIGRTEPPPQAVSVAAMAESVAEEVHAMHPECRIVISGAFPVLWFSELRVRQLFTNLLDNAAKHAAGEALVQVRAERSSRGGAVITIADNGQGISSDYREKAFEVFERLGAAHSDIPGTGMGLPICKRIVEAAGGTIRLEGPPPGVDSGTTVRIELPPAVVQGWHDVAQPVAKESTA
jgi:signal transduction histidine kinase